MKLTVQSKELLRVLSAVSRVVQKKNALPILDTALLRQREDGTFIITGSSEENSLTMAIDMRQDAGDTDKFRSVCLDLQRMQAAVATLSEQPIDIIIDDHFNTDIQYQGGRFHLMSQSPEYYPLPRTVAEARLSFDIPSEVLLPAMKAARVCTANDDLRPALSCVCMDVTEEGVIFVGTTGHVLYKYSFTPGVPFCQGTPRKILVPIGIIGALDAPFRGEETIHVEHDGHQVFLSTDQTEFIIRDIDTNYPNYNSVIPQSLPYHLTTNLREFLGALKRVSLMASDSSQLIALRKEEGGVVLSGDDIDFGTSGTENLNATTCTLPDGFAIGFHSEHMLALMGAVGTEDVRFEFSDPSKAIIIKEEATNSTLLELIMPMLLNG